MLVVPFLRLRVKEDKREIENVGGNARFIVKPTAGVECRFGQETRLGKITLVPGGGGRESKESCKHAFVQRPLHPQYIGECPARLGMQTVSEPIRRQSPGQTASGRTVFVLYRPLHGLACVGMLAEKWIPFGFECRGPGSERAIEQQEKPVGMSTSDGVEVAGGGQSLDTECANRFQHFEP